jgi:signal-transduction protein with cAMP-binding, CBS, and nucleotidyltransferase domain
MVKIEDIRRINLFRDMPEPLLELVAGQAQLSIYNTGFELTRINERVDRLYMLTMGQVALKINLMPDVDIILDTVQSGSSFGLSSLVTGEAATCTAVCQEPCEVITLPGERMIQLFGEVPLLGYQVMRRLAMHYKTLLDSRAQMIMRTLDRHPELKDRIDDLDTLTPAF